MEEQQLKITCENLLNETVTEIKSVAGGEINLSYQIETIHNVYFCKTNITDIGEDILKKEETGLRILNRYCSIPTIIKTSPQVLIFNWIKEGSKTKKFWDKLGEELGTLHKVSSNQFGFEHDNYIGSLPQNNDARDSWGAFYVSQRLAPQFKLAVEKGLLNASDIPSQEKMEQTIKDVCPPEVASLIHGDLWSGNILCDKDSNAFFIDPCVSYAHREMDIAMSALFAKFDDRFYEAYHDRYPLMEGWKGRLSIYQLYYLLAHLNMFGIGYKNDVLKIVKRYFG